MTTAYRWWREGTLPVPARQEEAAGLYARVSSRDQEAGLARQAARLSGWAARAGVPVVRVEASAGMNGTRARARRVLAGPEVTVVVAGHPDRLGGMNSELAEAALAARGRRLVVVDAAEVTGDLVRDMTGVLTSFGAQLYGGRPARNWALKAARCAWQDIGPRAVAGAGPCGGTG